MVWLEKSPTFLRIVGRACVVFGSRPVIPKPKTNPNPIVQNLNRLGLHLRAYRVEYQELRINDTSKRSVKFAEAMSMDT